MNLSLFLIEYLCYWYVLVGLSLHFTVKFCFYVIWISILTKWLPRNCVFFGKEIWSKQWCSCSLFCFLVPSLDHGTWAHWGERAGKLGWMNGCSSHAVCLCSCGCALRSPGSMGHRAALWPPPWVVWINYPWWSVQSGPFHISFRSSEKPCFYLVTSWSKGLVQDQIIGMYFINVILIQLWYCGYLIHYFQSTFQASNWTVDNISSLQLYFIELNLQNLSNRSASKRFNFSLTYNLFTRHTNALLETTCLLQLCFSTCSGSSGPQRISHHPRIIYERGRSPWLLL